MQAYATPSHIFAVIDSYEVTWLISICGYRNLCAADSHGFTKVFSVEALWHLRKTRIGRVLVCLSVVLRGAKESGLVIALTLNGSHLQLLCVFGSGAHVQPIGTVSPSCPG